MTTNQLNPLERAKCGQLEVLDYDFSSYSSSYTHDGRHVAYLRHNKFWFLDLFHMKKKSFEIDYRVIPKSPTRRRLTFEGVHLLHDKRAFVLITELLENIADERENFYVAQLDIDHESSQCVVRRFHRFKRGEGKFDSFISITNGRLGIFFNAARNDDLMIFFEISNPLSNDWTLAKSGEYSIMSDMMGSLDGCVYDFPLDQRGVQFSKLVKVCMKTNEETTLNLKGAPERSAGNKLYADSWIWMGRQLIVNVLEYNPEGGFKRSRGFLLDLNSLEWRQLEWNLDNRVHTLIADGKNILFVITQNQFCKKPVEFYRFAINSPDCLATTCWIAVRKHAKQMPGFDRYVLDRLPKNSPFRCAFD